MKKVILGLLAVLVVLGLFATAGFAGYHFGYAQGAQTAANGKATSPEFRPFEGTGPRGMPMHRFGSERGLQRGWGPGGFRMMGFGFFPLMFLGRLVILGLIIWFIYWLFTRSGWRLTRQPVEARQTESVTTKTENE
ncbi:MAG: hypothetical protein ACM33V_01330 [Chloroflexota bacterium]